MKRQVRSQAILRIWLGGAVMLSPLQVATAADRLFAGEDAAYIDWAFSNCKIVSTQKERGLASQASSTGGETFVKAYERQFHKLAETASSATARTAACEQVKAWYGPLGSRIPALGATERQPVWDRLSPPSHRAARGCANRAGHTIP